MRIKWFSFVRVTGLLLVLLYHFFKSSFPGGFLGVDIFFVFSGYLITGLLIDEYEKKQGIDYLGFVKRRFYRIFPPLLLMVLVSIPMTFLVREDFVASLRVQTAAALGFVTNFYEMLTGGSYESQFIPHLFVHTWSLAIEFQYYLLWALLVWFLAKKVRTTSRFRGLISLASLGLFLISFIAMVVGSFTTTNHSSIYFSSLTHVFPFFLGSLLASLTGVKTLTKSFSAHMEKLDWRKALAFMVAGFLGLVLLMLTLNFDSKLTYRLGFLLSSLFTLLMIVGARVLHEKTSHLKEPRIISFLSDISYGIYLFHWPLYVIFGQLMDNGLNAVLTTVTSVVLSALSFYVIEPMLAGQPLNAFGVKLALTDLKFPFAVIGLPLLVASLYVLTTAPTVSPFEANLMVQGLKQANTNMHQTRLAAENSNASEYNVTEGVTIIGDSVALRASDWLTEALPSAQVDAAVSRNLETLLEVYQKGIDNNLLMQNVVIAIGANVHNNYEDLTKQLLEKLPKGHRLIFVTPYSTSDTTGLVVAQRDLEYSLAEANDYVYIADWYTTATSNPQIWGGTDGVHFGGDSASIIEGGQLYAQTIAQALETAQAGPVKK